MCERAAPVIYRSGNLGDVQRPPSLPYPPGTLPPLMLKSVCVCVRVWKREKEIENSLEPSEWSCACLNPSFCMCDSFTDTNSTAFAFLIDTLLYSHFDATFSTLPQTKKTMIISSPEFCFILLNCDKRFFFSCNFLIYFKRGNVCSKLNYKAFINSNSPFDVYLLYKLSSCRTNKMKFLTCHCEKGLVIVRSNFYCWKIYEIDKFDPAAKFERR
jgi:hypothetical protein